ncbi:MAG TPA: hypothetical protein VGH20_08950 [Myxococcales bacterium]|jgi:hypothetical protein
MRLALLLLVLGCAAPKPAFDSSSRAPADPNARADGTADLNALARADYAQARDRAFANAGPALLVGPAQITLVDGSRRVSMELAPAAYHQLKTVAHLALGIHSLFFEEVPPHEKLLELRAATLRMPLPEPRQRQERIVQLSLRTIDDALAGHADLAAYEREVAPLLLDNAVDAARLQIADLDRAVAQVRARLGEAGFARLHVVVVGAHMAREGEISLQYFEKLFGEREGQRIVFAEGLWDEKSELTLLATHLLDSSIGEGFFHDPRRMHRDLLSDAAAQVLRERR